MKTLSIQRMDLRMDEWEAILERAQAGPLNEAEREKLKAVGESYIYLLKLLEDKRTTINHLRKLLFGSGSEKTRDVFPDPAPAPAATEDPAGPGEAPAGPTGPAEPPPDSAEPPKQPATPRKGHGRNGADDYPGAQRIRVPHGSLRPSDPCPACREGTVYEFSPPGVLVRITGQAPVQATVYELQKLRCNRCGQVFTAEPPEGVGHEKYDPTAASIIALLKYGNGMPFNRLDGLQGGLEIPLPASTQWQIVEATARRIQPVHEELIRQAAQGEVLHNDDTAVLILEFMGQRARPAALAEEASDRPAKGQAQRRGMFTSGIVSTNQGRRIGLFFSGRRHAGENLADVLRRRASELGPPIQMCDGLSRNRPTYEGGQTSGSRSGGSTESKELPRELQTILANCLAHGRRQFVEVAEQFPEECRHVLDELAEVYRNDARARQRNLSPEERLQFHQAESGPVMERLKEWLTRQLADRRVEPNSSLGQAIAYLLKRWEPLTLFLRKAGAPLDNNIAERALKLAIRNRRNALFYKTLNGAHVGDLFMSLIHTCQLNAVNPFDYLTELQRHADELALAPEKWMPWNYRETLAGGRTSPDSVS